MLEVRTRRKKRKEKGPHLILVGKLGKFDHIRKVHLEDQENLESSLGKLGKKSVRQESLLGKLGKLEVRPKKKRSSPNFGWDIRKVEPNQESSSGILGKLGKFIRKIRKVHLENQEDQESSFGRLGKFIRNIRKEIPPLGKLTQNIRKVGGET